MQKQVYSAQDLGEVIRSARMLRKMTQRELAAELGVTQAWISSVEKGNEKSQIGGVLRLASFLDINLKALWGEKPEPIDTDMAKRYLDLIKKAVSE